MSEHMATIDPRTSMGPRIVNPSESVEPSVAAFGQRARARGMIPERLFVQYTPLEERALRSVEYLLNRTYFPILGDR